jgi:hypothetical protein
LANFQPEGFALWQSWDFAFVFYDPRVAKAQPWAGIGERLQRLEQAHPI